jgi:RHS repeat-associated protein
MVDKFVHGDWLGRTRYLSDSTGLLTPNALRFDGYGRLSRSEGGTHPTEFQWAGGWGYQREFSSASEPGLGLDYLQQRYYDPQAGRFLTPDPIGFAGGFNLYAYVGSDPVQWADPSGLAAENRTFATRRQAFLAAKRRAGVPLSKPPDDQWIVGGDPKKRATGGAKRKNYVYCENPKKWGRYYQYNTPAGPKVVVDHTSDPTAPSPHMHGAHAPDLEGPTGTGDRVAYFL